MAQVTNVNVTSSYPGKIDPRILQNLFRGVELFTGVPGMPGASGASAYLVQAGSPDKYYLNKMSATNLDTVAREQIPTAKGDVTQVEMNFEGREQQIYLEFDPFTYKNAIPEHQPSGGNILDWAFNPKVQAAILDSIFRVHKDNLQRDLLLSDLSLYPNGDSSLGAGDGTGRSSSGGSTEATGLLTRIADATGSLAYENNYGVDGFSAANIMTSIEDMLSNIPGVIYFRPSLKIFMSVKNWDTLKNAVRNKYDGKGPTILDPVSGRIDGRQVIPMNQWPDDKIVITYADNTPQSNFWVVTNKYSDMADKFRWDKLQNNSELMFMKLLYKYDTQILFPEHIVLGTATA